MPYYLPQKLIWLFHAHTGSRSTLKALQNIQLTDKQQKERNKKENLLEDHHGVLESEQGREVIASTIRDPIDYVLSWWRHSARPTAKPIDYFNDTSLASRHFQQNGRLFYHADISDILVSYDNLDTNVRKVCIDLGLPDPGKLPVIGVSEKRESENYQEFRDQLTGPIKERYPTDVELWLQISAVQILDRNS